MDSSSLKFSYTSLKSALTLFVKNDQSNLIEESITVIKKQLAGSANPERRELIRAIFATQLFDNTSTIPQKIADSFDLMIRRPVPKINLDGVKEKINNQINTVSSELLNYINSNQKLKSILGSYHNDAKIDMLKLYLKLVNSLYSFDHKTITDRILCSDSMCNTLISLEDELKIFSNKITDEHKGFRKNLYKLFLSRFLEEFACGTFSPFPFVQNDSMESKDSYLDLFSGNFNIKYLDQFLSNKHNTQFLFLDRSKAVKEFYDMVDELTEGEFSKRVKLVTQEFFSDWGESVKESSMETIRGFNIDTFIKAYDEDNFSYNIKGAFEKIDKALKPGGKFIIGLRYNPENQNEEIAINPLLDQNVWLNSLHSTLVNLLTIMIPLAIQKGYVFQIGHTDKDGNFINGKSGKFNMEEFCFIDTELIMIKPKP
jgi:hypothetical protein